MGYPVLTGGVFVSVCKELAGKLPSIFISVLFLVTVNVCAQEPLIIRELKYEKLILKSAAKHGVDPMLVKAIIFTESTFRPEMVGKDGEIGLMQIRRGAATDWARTMSVPVPSKAEMFRPELNIEIGTWYITRALKRWYENPDFLRMALAEYNAGRSRLLEWMATYNEDTDLIMAYEPVGKYVDKVCRKYVEYTITSNEFEIPPEKQQKIVKHP